MLIQEVVRPEINALPRTTVGTVVAYSKEHNLCAVQLSASSMHASAGRILLEVPVVISNGLNTCGPFPGQQVVVEFLDGQPNSPVIIGIVDRVYETTVREAYHRHESQGAYVADTISKREFKYSESGPGWGKV